MADRAMHHYYRLLANQQRHRALAVRRGQLLLASGRVFMLVAAVILMHMLTTTGGALECTLDEHYGDAFVALLLWLLGAALTMLSLVAGQFPALAAAAAAIAKELGDHLLGGL